MRNLFLTILVLIYAFDYVFGQSIHNQTFCNPLELPYRFEYKKPSHRTSADPTIVTYQGTYFLFASYVGGFYYSDDLVNWKLHQNENMPLKEPLAPGAINLGDTLLLFGATLRGEDAIFYSIRDPFSDDWQEEIKLPFDVFDVAYFIDDDNRFYLYWGLSNRDPIYGIELDMKNNFQPIGERVDLLTANYEEHGWEMRPLDKVSEKAPWIEGAWVNKFNGKYYLQYAGPGTEFDTYADGVYVADKPLGPYTYQPYSPFSFKPTGFAPGAGHGSTFTDKFGNLWHFATSVISDRHNFERRISLFPVFLKESGQLQSHNSWGDYPYKVPQYKSVSIEDYRTQWQLLSMGKKTKASSTFQENGADLAFDENIKTYWIAASNKPGEWLSIDLDRPMSVAAIQVNFAEIEPEIFGYDRNDYHQYLIEYSTDGKSWKKLVDKRKNKTAVPHDYEVLPKSVMARYIKITNQYCPDQYFAIRDLRIFGWGEGKAPATPNFTEWYRNSFNQRYFRLKWEEVANATGYIIEYGINKDELFNHFIFYTGDSFEAVYLNKGVDYFFSISSFNENGVSPKSKVISLPASGTIINK